MKKAALHPLRDEEEQGDPLEDIRGEHRLHPPPSQATEAESLIRSVPTCRWAMDAFRTASASTPAASPASPSPEPVLGAPTSAPEIRVCEVCKKPIKGRAEKKVCSGKCRIILCRQRRHGALLDRLHVAEGALAQAAAALAALRQIAEQGPHATASLAVGR